MVRFQASRAEQSCGRLTSSNLSLDQTRCSQRHLPAAGAAVFATAAAGQAEPDVPHDGNWLATIQGADGSRQSARFVIREFSGDWIGAGRPEPGGAQRLRR